MKEDASSTVEDMTWEKSTKGSKHVISSKRMEHNCKQYWGQLKVIVESAERNRAVGGGER
jgi:hypothetical protein